MGTDTEIISPYGESLLHLQLGVRARVVRALIVCPSVFVGEIDTIGAEIRFPAKNVSRGE